MKKLTFKDSKFDLLKKVILKDIHINQIPNINNFVIWRKPF